MKNHEQREGNEKLLMINQEFEHDPRLSALRDWVKNTLPNLNKKVLNHELSYEDFQTIVIDLLKDLSLNIEFNVGQARSALQYLGFVMSSIERHSQDLGHEPGVAVASLGKEFNLFLQNLEVTAEHPPRDSVYTWCVWNRSQENDHEEPLTFTADKQELLFIDIVNQSFFAGDEAAELIRQVAVSSETMSSEANLANLRKATEALEQERQQYLRYLAKDEDGNPGMSADFFLNILRQYLIMYPVNGEAWGAPTAANSPHHWILDLLMKPIDEGYVEHIKGRMRYLTAEDKTRVNDVIDHPGLLEKLANEAGKTMVEINEMSENEYQEFIDSLSEYSRLAFERVAEFIKQFADTTSMHWSLIANYITKPLKVMTEVATTVSPELGTSGLTLSEVALIRDMRRNIGIAQRHKKGKRP